MVCADFNYFRHFWLTLYLKKHDPNFVVIHAAEFIFLYLPFVNVCIVIFVISLRKTTPPFCLHLFK